MPDGSRVLMVGIALSAIAASVCTDDGPPEAKRVTVDGERVWLIEDPPASDCDDDGSCGLGVYIGGRYYSIRCELNFHGPEDGALFGVSDSALASEARELPGDAPEDRVALHLNPADACPDRMDPWVLANGQAVDG